MVEGDSKRVGVDMSLIANIIGIPNTLLNKSLEAWRNLEMTNEMAQTHHADSESTMRSQQKSGGN